MLDAIRGFVDHAYVQQPPDVEKSGELPDHVISILSLLHARRNVDFSGYKKGTLIRRINRRMSVRHVSRGGDYLRMLRQNPEEVNALFNDMLIQVTHFFREPESWRVLENDVLPRLVAEADKDTPVRIWVPGCASGEEAYSLAILLLELIEKAQKPVPLQVFASDLDRASLDRARLGSYPDSIAADVSPERLERFFVKGEHRFVVTQLLRDTVIFAQQNLLVDPPFSRLDLISCRNVLIYLEAETQRRVFELFHFALRPGRYLFLGNSETVGPQTDLFQPLDKRARIYRRLGTVRSDRLRLSMTGTASLPATTSLPGLPPVAARENVALQHAREQVLERYTDAVVLVNRRFEILSLFGPTQNYIVQPSGQLTPDILYWVKEGVRTKLRVALQTAVRKQEPVTLRGLRMRRQDAPVTIAITVEPLTTAPESDGLLLVVFRDDAGVAPRLRGRRVNDSTEPLVRQLEYELKVARDDLQTSVEQLESSNEELRATNEEVLSMNEELQSANEELETSKEELQSVNEELSTVNNQLESKLVELQGLNDDITNLLTSTDLPTLFLDRDFLIRRFTPAMTRLFRLIRGDLGRPVSDIAHMVTDPTLLEDAREVLTRLTPVEKEVFTGQGSGFLRRVLPYRTENDRIEGVVVTYFDLAERIRADQSIRESRDFAEAIIETLREPLLVLDDHLVVKSANAAFYRVFQLAPDRVVGRRVYDVGSHEWNMPEFRKLLEQLLKDGRPVTDYEIRREFAGLGQRVLRVNANVVKSHGHIQILLAVEDVTTRIEAEMARNEALRQLVSYDEKERHRLALELHDETGQHLTAFLLGLSSLRDSSADRPEVHAVVQNLLAQAEDLARNLHGISLQLRPRALDDHDLERALFNYAEDLRLRHGLEVDFQTIGQGLGRLPGPLETVLYRATQEALTNVVKHAQAKKVSIVTSRKKREVQLIIEDDGRGFNPSAAHDGHHLGLRGMRERIGLAGGTMTVESAPGSGTTLFIRLPIRESDYDGDDA
jgi:two-component system CheB/CheR fusion protein